MNCLIFRCLVLVATGVATLQLRAADCSQFQIAANQARALVDADTMGINQLSAGFKLNASALNDWANMTADQKNKLYQTAVLNLIQAAAAAPFVKVAAGNLSLPNGIASIGPGQAGALINTLRSNGIDNPALFSLISGAAAVSGKPAAAKTGAAILGSLISLLQTGIATHSGDAVGSAASVAQLGLSLMGPAYADYATALGAGSDILTLVQSEVMASSAGDQVSQLTKVTDANLLELKRRIAKLKGDVQGLQKAKAQLAACNPTQNATMPTDTEIEACRKAREICASQYRATSYCRDARSFCDLCVRRRAEDRAFFPGTTAWVLRKRALSEQLDAVQGTDPEANAARRQILNQMAEADAQQRLALDKEAAKLVSTGIMSADRARCGVKTDELWLGYPGTLPSDYNHAP